MLGAGELEEAKDSDRKLMTFSIACAVAMAGFLVATSGLFPAIYNTGEGVRNLASHMIMICAATMPFCAFAHSAYFTLRSGGQVVVTFLFDSVFMWLVVLPISFLVAYGTGWDIHWIFAICQGTEILKCIFGYLLLRRETWVRQLVSDQSLKDTN
jgi:Na+-driven multidrug efflux pump